MENIRKYGDIKLTTTQARILNQNQTTTRQFFSQDLLTIEM